MDGVVKYYVFTVLVFGLEVVHVLFTKVTVPRIKHLWEQSIRIFRCMDDFLGEGERGWTDNPLKKW